MYSVNVHENKYPSFQKSFKQSKATLEDELTNALQMISHLKGNQINVHVLSWLITLVIHRLGEVPES